VKCNIDYSVGNNESLRGHCTNREESESEIRKWKEMWFKTTAEDGEMYRRNLLKRWSDLCSWLLTRNLQRTLWYIGRHRCCLFRSLCASRWCEDQ